MSRPRRLLVFALLLIIAILALSRWAGCGRAGRVTHGASSDSASTGVRSARLYFGASDGNGLTLETRELMDAPGVHARVAALVAELDRGPHGGGVAVLPEGTYVLHAYLNDQGLLTLDLSRAFTQGFRGGSTSEWLAVASLIRTLGDNLPEVKRVLLVCGGAPIATLGGHIALDRPLEVSEWP